MDARQLSGAALVQALRACRERTLAWTGDLTEAQWKMPHQPGMNPVAWELAHLAWFAEFWMLRGPHRVDERSTVQAAKPALHAGPDGLLDSSLIAHASRWTAPLPSRQRVLEMMDAQLQACIAAVPSGQDDDALYPHRLGLFHEDMHGEAFAWMRAALAYPQPRGVGLARVPEPVGLAVRGGEVRLGRAPGLRGFAFDNELPGCLVSLDDFEIDSGPITAGQFLAFVEAGGYDRAQFWPDEAGTWRAASKRAHPARWRRRSGSGDTDLRWEQRWFDQWRPLDPAQPMIHVNAFEAQAYCHWAGRRLPTAAQWEHAAAASPVPGGHGSGAAFAWGNSVWEWTADAFEPYPGFVPGPYKDYSAPWFRNHRELRGGAFVTHPRMHNVRYRNFFTPERSDIFAGFRTVAGHG